MLPLLRHLLPGREPDRDEDQKLKDPPFDEGEGSDLELHVRMERIRFGTAFDLLRSGRGLMRSMDNRLYRIEIAIYTAAVFLAAINPRVGEFFGWLAGLLG